MRKALLWKTLSGQAVACGLCAHYCRIDEGERGKCGVRQNLGGELYTLVYDKVAAINLDPVEKKPLYHFLAGSKTFSLGAMGCNFSCAFCQNSQLAQSPSQGLPVQGQKVTPEILVQSALQSGAASLSYTYSEPTVFFELMRDTALLAKEKGLKNILVSNGFQSPQCLSELSGLIDAANIDLKAFSENFYKEICGARLAPVLENLKTIRELGWWLEVTTLVIPELNDSQSELSDLAQFIARELGSGTPWHISRFFPQYRMLDRPPTPLERLEVAAQAGRAAGLKYVYQGNLPGGEHGDTVCPQCGLVLVKRRGFTVLENKLASGACSQCGHAVPGVWKP